ncbi:hypothetical protein OG994_16625 [Micromonospora globbae]|uniref:HK97 gp10 family phage protein n=1 Tax=Micromonospora globbae TaxID=1894969 RepID=A0ABZ1RYL3_9ACTN|nr:hypothetical protein [Micromonospora globbae]
MTGNLDDLIRDLNNFNRRGEVVKQLRTEFRKPVPAVRKAIRKRALTDLPARGGLNRWTAKTRITAKVQISRRTVRVTLRGGRNSASGKRSDIRRLDQGRVRHPSWGRRGAGQWHTQAVRAGFFTGPATEIDQWRDACVRAANNAFDTIRRG